MSIIHVFKNFQFGARLISKWLLWVTFKELSLKQPKKLPTGFFSEEVTRSDTNPFLSMIFRGFSAEIQPKCTDNHVQTRISSTKGQTQFQVSFWKSQRSGKVRVGERWESRRLCGYSQGEMTCTIGDSWGDRARSGGRQTE